MILFSHITPTPQNLDEVAALYCECFNAPEKGENWTQDSALSYFAERVDEGTIFLGARHKDGKLAGVCCGAPYARTQIAQDLNLPDPTPQIYISLLAIEASCRAQGYGKILLQKFCAFMQQNGYSDFIIRCRAENTPMLNLLDQTGFIETRRTESELGGVTCQRVILRGTPQP